MPKASLWDNPTSVQSAGTTEELVQQRGYIPDAVFSVFKDELLKVSPVFAGYFTAVDPKTFLQENLN